jgi:hypothetical protein
MGVDIGLAPNWKGTLYGPPLAATLALSLLSAESSASNACRLLVPFLFGEANPNSNLKPSTWLAIIAGRARPDEPEVVGGVQEGGGW